MAAESPAMEKKIMSVKDYKKQLLRNKLMDWSASYILVLFYSTIVLAILCALIGFWSEYFILTAHLLGWLMALYFVKE